MSERCILVAEDDTAIRCALVDALRASGYAVLEAANGQQALELLLIEGIDLALMDVNMPHRDGFSLLKVMQRECPGVPSILLTARGEEHERVKGLTLGADDYVIKPFSMVELLARISAVLRRYPVRRLAATKNLSFEGGHLSPDEKKVIFDTGNIIELSTRETELFRYFLMHPDRIIPQEELLLRIWNSDAASSQTRMVAVNLTRLKEKLGAPLATRFENVRGRGYRFNS